MTSLIWVVAAVSPSITKFWVKHLINSGRHSGGNFIWKEHSFSLSLSLFRFYTRTRTGPLCSACGAYSWLAMWSKCSRFEWISDSRVGFTTFAGLQHRWTHTIPDPIADTTWVTNRVAKTLGCRVQANRNPNENRALWSDSVHAQGTGWVTMQEWEGWWVRTNTRLRRTPQRPWWVFTSHGETDIPTGKAEKTQHHFSHLTLSTPQNTWRLAGLPFYCLFH